MIWLLMAVCGWFIIANLGAMLPSRDHHWWFAYGLIAVGIPLLGLVTYVAGPWVGLAILLAGASVLRWPLVALWRRIGGAGDSADG